MAKSTPSVIYLKNVNRDGTQSFEEGEATATIRPGDLVSVDYSANTDRKYPDLTASDGSVAWDQLAIALEKEYDDANTADAIDATYAAGENLRFVIPKRGDRVYVAGAAGYTAAIGDIVVDGGATTAGRFASAGTVDATTITNTLKGKAVSTAPGAGGRFIMEVL